LQACLKSLVVFGKLDANHNVAIYRLDLKTGKASSIPDSDGFYSPRVSPDGRYVSALAGGLAIGVNLQHTFRKNGLESLQGKKLPENLRSPMVSFGELAREALAYS
jgi:hypothetical protein